MRREGCDLRRYDGLLRDHWWLVKLHNLTLLFL